MEDYGRFFLDILGDSEGHGMTSVASNSRMILSFNRGKMISESTPVNNGR